MPAEFSSLFKPFSISLIPPVKSRTEIVQWPVGNYGDLAWVEVITVGVILLAFAIVAHASCRTAFRIRTHLKVE